MNDYDKALDRIDGQWWHAAMCKSADWRIFFSERPEKKQAALFYCQSCPVRTECLESCDAEERPYGTYVYGVRGGETADERKARRGNLKTPRKGMHKSGRIMGSP